jgi:hypothetical protein
MKTFRQFITEAQQRLRFVRQYHGTSKDAAEKIKKSGFNTSDVFASTDRDIATSFARRYTDRDGTKVLSLRIPKKDIKDKPPAKIVKTDGQRAVDNWGREHYSTVMDPKYATKHLSKEREGVVQAPKIPSHYRKQYFKQYPNSRFKRRTKIRLKQK